MASNALLQMIAAGPQQTFGGGVAKGLALKSQLEGNALQRQMQNMQMQAIVNSQLGAQQKAQQQAQTQNVLGEMFGPGYARFAA